MALQILVALSLLVALQGSVSLPILLIKSFLVAPQVLVVLVITSYTARYVLEQREYDCGSETLHIPQHKVLQYYPGLLKTSVVGVTLTPCQSGPTLVGVRIYIVYFCHCSWFEFLDLARVYISYVLRI